MYFIHILFRFLKGYAWPYRLWFCAGILFLYLTNWLTVQIPLEIARAIDFLHTGGANAIGVRKTALVIVGIGIAIIGIRTASRLWFFSPGRYIEANLRAALFKQLSALQPDYYDAHPAGEIISKLTNDIASVRALAGFASLQAVNVVMGLGLGITRMLSVDVRMTAYCLAPIALLFLAMQGGLRKIFIWVRRSQIALASLSTHVLSSYNGIATIRAFNAEASFGREFDTRNDAYVETSLAMGLLRALLLPLVSLMGSLGLFVLLYFGGSLVAAQRLSIGQLAALIGLVATMLPPLMSLGWLVNVVQRGVSALERLYQILDTTPSHIGLRRQGARPLDPKLGYRGDNPCQGVGQRPTNNLTETPLLSVKHLSFTYPGSDQKVLDDISFDLHAGEIVGIFGRTGSGKSTLLSVIARLYSPPAGRLYIDEEDALSYSLEDYRRFFSMVPQRPFLFSTSIQKNIEMGQEKPLAPDELQTAICESELTPAIATFPQGIDTVVGPRGVMLSGGERQRVTLARALANPAPILLLDDILSAVDHVTEERLIANLYARKRTALLVSHRISALRRADRIIVLDAGQIIATGTHAELVRQNELYAHVWRRQRLESEEGTK